MITRRRFVQNTSLVSAALAFVPGANLALAAAAILLATVVPASAAGKKIIFDTDPGTDDALALMLALKRHIHTGRDNQAAKHWRGMISEIAAREDQLGGKTMLIVGGILTGVVIAQIIGRAAGATAAWRGIMGLHGQTNDVVALFHEQRCGRRRIDPA